MSFWHVVPSGKDVDRGRREAEEGQRRGGRRRSRPDGGVAEVRGARAGAGDAVGAAVGRRSEAAALTDCHATLKIKRKYVV